MAFGCEGRGFESYHRRPTSSLDSPLLVAASFLSLIKEAKGNNNSSHCFTILGYSECAMKLNKQVERICVPFLVHISSSKTSAIRQQMQPNSMRFILVDTRTYVSLTSHLGPMGVQERKFTGSYCLQICLPNVSSNQMEPEKITNAMMKRVSICIESLYAVLKIRISKIQTVSRNTE